MAEQVDNRRSGKTDRRELAPVEVLLEKLADRFDKSAKRWEMVVYPALFAFVVLAGYGFFLVYSLSKDMNTLAAHIDSNMNENMATMTESIESLAFNVAVMTDRMNEMAIHIEGIDEATEDMNAYLGMMQSDMSDVTYQLGNLTPIVKAMGNMDVSMRNITATTGIMSQDMNRMQQSVRPMGVMSSFMPW